MGTKERKEREKEARKEEIISAAEKVFFQKGLVAATMDEIAELAELSKGTIYLYYKSKEDLYLAVSIRGLEVMHDLFQKALSNGQTTVQQIANLGEAYYEFFKSNRNYFRMFIFFENPRLQTQVSEEMKEQCSVAERRVWDLVVKLIQRGIDEGMLHKGLDPLEAGVMLWSNSNGLMRLMDREDNYWVEHMGLDLENTLRKSNAFLVESMMTKKAHKLFGKMLFYHGTEDEKTESQ